MRLLVLNWQDLANPQAGGAEVHIHNVFGRLAAWGHEVTLVTSGWSGAPPRDHIDGMQVLRVGSRYTFGARVPAFARRELATRHFDGIVETLNKVPVFTPRWSTRPAVLLVHHLFGTTAFREAPLGLAAATWLLERAIPPVYRGVPAQAMSCSTRDDLIARGLRADDIEVIYAGVDTAVLTPAPARRATVPRFVYLGRLKKYKRVDLLIHAVAELRRAGTACEAVIAGKGESERVLRQLADRLGVGAHVRFAGFVSEQEKLELFRSAWANVFTSPKEGWGITNLEAAAAGTPSVASDSPGLRESVRHEQTGLLVPHGNLPALVAALGSLARDPARVEALGANARQFAETLTWDRTATETADHLRRAFGAAQIGEPCRS